jgi:hypothetical protein
MRRACSLVFFAATTLAGCDDPPSKPAPAAHTGPTIHALPFTIENVMLSDLFINELKVAKVNVQVKGGTQEEWAATALAIAYAVGNLGANSIEATVDRSDLTGMEPAPLYLHLAKVMYSPDPKHTVWTDNPETLISTTEQPATKEEVQRDTEYWAMLDKLIDKGVESDSAEKKAGAAIAKKFHLLPDWQLYNGGLDDRKFPKADYSVDTSRAANSLAALDACMRGKIIRLLKPCE